MSSAAFTTAVELMAKLAISRAKFNSQPLFPSLSLVLLNLFLASLSFDPHLLV